MFISGAFTSVSTGLAVASESDYSFGYVAGWSSGRELDELKSSLETIRSTAAEIINSIDEHLQEIQKEQTQKEAAAPDKDTFSIYQLKRFITTL